MNLKPTIMFCVLLCACFFANAQIINTGVLKISTNSNVYFEEEYTNTVAGNHVSNGNLYLNNSFINHGATSATAGTTYFKSASNNFLNLSGSAENANFYNLEIDITPEGLKGVSVADEFLVQVENALNLKSGDLRLTGEAQLIQEHSGVDANTINSGKLILDQQGTVSPFQYDYWSSPVNNGGTFSFMGGKFDGTDSSLNPFNPTQIGFTTDREGLPSSVDGSGNVTTALSISSRWLYKYARESGAYSEWIRLNSGSILNPGEGYTMKGANASGPEQNYVFYGAPNNGDYTFPITVGQEILLGNPYPSALDATKFITDNDGVLEALYFWVDGGSTSHILSDYLGGYSIRNKTGGSIPSIPSPLISGIGTSGTVGIPSQYVPVGKGFFIKSIGSGDIIFNNSQRFFKLEEARLNVNDKYIRIGYEDPEGFHRQLLLGFMPDSSADLNYNPGYDAIQMMSRDDDMFFIIEEDETKRYAIQGVDGFSEFLEFPIGLVISETGSHYLMLDDVENFEETIYLKDNVLDTTYNLSESDFEINLPAGFYSDRFSIVFQPAETLSTPEVELDKTLVFYNGQNQIVVSNPNNLEITGVEIYNILGQHILSVTKNLTNQNKVLIPFNESTGVYMVVLKTNNAQKSTKILKY
ncbi:MULTISPECIES: T9SS sorting signal type C domain-containing protein [Bizionia]|uniref:T9SS type A sorting domain-containing protein n=1 Tax=Bizionia algoritergicola TaxID=291187 RepID=A0A5D0QZR2_9FLAO|nr:MULTISPECIES: T9SS sorting signal type C domain-containing protein [Bizionia]OBX23092.1 ABC transporter permease [Bizionia sp. APA-3]TYB74752.1 T9SS type A sorting domain-containing protein [Bizionia algoritergicola]